MGLVEGDREENRVLQVGRGHWPKFARVYTGLALPDGPGTREWSRALGMVLAAGVSRRPGRRDRHSKNESRAEDAGGKLGGQSNSALCLGEEVKQTKPTVVPSQPPKKGDKQNKALYPQE